MLGAVRRMDTIARPAHTPTSSGLSSYRKADACFCNPSCTSIPRFSLGWPSPPSDCAIISALQRISPMLLILPHTPESSPIVVRRASTSSFERSNPHVYWKVVHYASLSSRSPISLSIIKIKSGSLPSRASQSNSLRSKPWLIRSLDSAGMASSSTRIFSRSFS